MPTFDGVSAYIKDSKCHDIGKTISKVNVSSTQFECGCEKKIFRCFHSLVNLVFLKQNIIFLSHTLSFTAKTTALLQYILANLNGF